MSNTSQTAWGAPGVGAGFTASLWMVAWHRSPSKPRSSHVPSSTQGGPAAQEPFPLLQRSGFPPLRDSYTSPTALVAMLSLGPPTLGILANFPKRVSRILVISRNSISWKGPGGTKEMWTKSREEGVSTPLHVSISCLPLMPKLGGGHPDPSLPSPTIRFSLLMVTLHPSSLSAPFPAPRPLE